MGLNQFRKHTRRWNSLCVFSGIQLKWTEAQRTHGHKRQRELARICEYVLAVRVRRRLSTEEDVWVRFREWRNETRLEPVWTDATSCVCVVVRIPVRFSVGAALLVGRTETKRINVNESYTTAVNGWLWWQRRMRRKERKGAEEFEWQIENVGLTYDKPTDLWRRSAWWTPACTVAFRCGQGWTNAGTGSTWLRKGCRYDCPRPRGLPEWAICMETKAHTQVCLAYTWS